jgi:acetyltransferase
MHVIVLYGTATDPADIPNPAIRPYPSKYAGVFTTLEGTPFPHPAHSSGRRTAVRKTSRDVIGRKRVPAILRTDQRRKPHTARTLKRICFIDYDRQMALVAERTSKDSSPAEIVGIGRLIKSRWPNEAELAAIVSDSFQHKGIGRTLVRRLIDFARDEKLHLLSASVLAENRAMLKLLQSEGFEFHDSNGPEVLEGELWLNHSQPWKAQPRRAAWDCVKKQNMREPAPRGMELLAGAPPIWRKCVIF